VFCNEHSLPVDWEYVDKLINDVDTIILHMKYKYNRPRPKILLKNEDDDWSDVNDNTSPSFPSGHTAIGYFICSILTDAFPDYANDLKTYAELIGQSRIENGVHYPSDVLYGQLIGEMLSDLFINDEKYLNVGKVNLKLKDYREFSNHLMNLAIEEYPDLSESECLKKYAHNLSNFLQRSNEIEHYNIPYDECYNVSLNFLMGFPVEHITNNPHLISHLAGLTTAYKLSPIDNPYKILRIHEIFHPDTIERESPGSLRNFDHRANSGHQFASPASIFKYLNELNNVKNPWIKHILYEWIHPFADGNGRSGRIILATDVDFDFDKILHFIDENYIKRIVKFIDNYADMNELFKQT
jgi:hypothetical protein